MRAGCLVAVIVGLFGVPAFLISTRQEPPTPKITPAAPTVPAPIILPANDRVDVSKIVWKRVGFKTVAEASFLLTNRNERPVRDAVVSCDFVGNSGTRISTARRTIFETIEAGKSLPVREISFGFIDQQATGARCLVVDAKWN